MYNVEIKKSIAKGEVLSPPSKSVSHRYLIGAALTNAKITIKNIAYSDDIKATIKSLVAFGCEIEENDDSVVIDATNFFKKTSNLNANESGSTLRFLIPLCLIDGKERTIMGSEKLLTRPLDEYIKLCNDNNTKDNECYININKNYITLKGKLNKDNYTLSSSLSSQFITGMIFALSYMRKEASIKLIGEINSKSYIDMTISVLNEIGFNISWGNDNTIYIKKDFKLKKNTFIVEGDYSNAAFLDSFNFINDENRVKVLGLNDDSLQGDKIYKKYFLDIKNGTPTLDIKNAPDLGPILIVLSAINNGSKLIGTKRLKIKESDRASAMKEELKKLGIIIEVYDDEIIVNKSIIKPPNDYIFSHNDHRIVMAMSVILSIVGGKIKNANAINKSYPNFFTDIEKLGIEVLYEI